MKSDRCNTVFTSFHIVGTQCDSCERIVRVPPNFSGDSHPGKALAMTLESVVFTSVPNDFAICIYASCIDTTVISAISNIRVSRVPSTVCLEVSTNKSDAPDLMMKAVEKALQDGLFGQMLQQFAVLFEQMDMLVERFHSGGRNQEKAAVIAPVFALTSSVCSYLHILILTCTPLY